MRLLIISVIIYLCTLFLGILGETMGFSNSNRMNIVYYSLLIAFSMNLVGFVFGILERRKDYENAVNGIVGNLVPILIVVILITYMTTVISIGPM
ncbi:MAG: hypothetical protein HWE22_11545 [Flavobacteriales bacterium]|nr:hypothetical protein [Flavobacteriales bacterium]